MPFDALPSEETKHAEARHLLLSAADVIRERGWTSGGTQKDGRVCALMALALAADAPVYSPTGAHLLAMNALSDHLGVPRGCSGIFWWNDTLYSRTWRPERRVILALEGAAASL